MKTKDKGEVRNCEKIIANGVQLLNGDACVRHSKIPIILLDYKSPKTAHPFAAGERFAFWFKLEDAKFKELQTQLNKDLRELTIWLTKEDRQKLRDMLNKIEADDNLEIMKTPPSLPVEKNEECSV